MAYKLYDFDDPELDEQVRLICDVLYNKREIYPGQLSTLTSLRTLWKARSWHAVKFSGVGVDVSAGNNQFSTIGCSGSYSAGAKASTVTTWDQINPYGNLLTAAALDDNYSFGIHTGLSGGGWWIAPYNPYVQFAIKTGPIVNMTLFIGACADPFSTNPTNVQEDLPAAYGGWSNFIGFRFLSTNTTWDVIHRNGASAATILSTSIDVTTETAYYFEMETTDRGVTWIMKINGTTVATLTTNIPDTSFTTAPSMQEIAWIRNKLAGTARYIKLRSIYTEFGGDIGLTS